LLRLWEHFQVRVSLMILLVTTLGFGCNCRNTSKITSMSLQRSDLNREGSADIIAQSMQFAEFRELMWSEQPDAEFAPLAANLRDSFATLIAMLWNANASQNADQMHKLATDIGMRLLAIDVEGLALWVLQDPPEHRCGNGAYVFFRNRPAGRSEILVQATHVYFDEGTGFIAAAAFVSSESLSTVRAMFANTAHRYWQPDAARSKRSVNVADPSQNETHPLMWATAAVLAQRHSQPLTIVQLHGFDRDKPASAEDDPDIERDSAATFDAIVSAGRSDASSSSVRAVAVGLRARSWKVAVFPDEVRELGGTRNVIGSLCRASGANFVHIEIAAARRNQLKASREQSGRFGAVLWTSLAEATK
jgi:hypothetical protein